MIVECLHERAEPHFAVLGDSADGMGETRTPVGREQASRLALCRCLPRTSSERLRRYSGRARRTNSGV
jgi:hypothetical protein